MKIPAVGPANRNHRLAAEGRHPMQRPEVVSHFLGELNPSCQEGARKKISERRLREYSDGTAKCGWGVVPKGGTPFELLLLESLAPLGFVGQHRVRTGQPYVHYHLDLAHVELRLCIEVDGKSHRKTQDRDYRKDTFLTARGWTVLRVTNDEVNTALDEVLDTVKHLVKLKQEHMSHSA